MANYNIRGDFMPKLIITAGSITTAVRIKKTLNSIGGINATVINTPSSINQGGCSYSVRTDYNNLNLVRNLASEKKIKFRKLYMQTNEGGEVLYNAIS